MTGISGRASPHLLISRWLYQEVTDKTNKITPEMLEEIDLRMESLGFEMLHETIKVSSLLTPRSMRM